MPRPTGLKKTGGRKKGTPNKRTSDFIEALEHSQIDLVGEIAKILPGLEINKKADILLSLLNYAFPKRKAIEAVEPIDCRDEETITPEDLEYVFADDDRARAALKLGEMQVRKFQQKGKSD